MTGSSAIPGIVRGPEGMSDKWREKKTGTDVSH